MFFSNNKENQNLQKTPPKPLMFKIWLEGYQNGWRGCVVGYRKAVGAGGEEMCTRLSCLLFSSTVCCKCDLLCSFKRKQFKMHLYQLLYVRTVVNTFLNTCTQPSVKSVHFFNRQSIFHQILNFFIAGRVHNFLKYLIFSIQCICFTLHTPMLLYIKLGK